MKEMRRVNGGHNVWAVGIVFLTSSLGTMHHHVTGFATESVRSSGAGVNATQRGTQGGVYGITDGAATTQNVRSSSQEHNRSHHILLKHP